MTGPDQAGTRANAVITVRKYEPASHDEPAQGPVLTTTHAEEGFSGDISGDGVAAGVRDWWCRVWHGALLGPGCW